MLPSVDPLFNLTDKFQTSPLYIGPSKLLEIVLILPAEESANEPDAITKWANDAESELVISKLCDIPIIISLALY